MSEMNDTGIRLFGKMIQLGSDINEDTKMASRVELSAAVDTAGYDDDNDCDCDSDCDCGCIVSDDSSKQGENRGDEKASTEEPMDIKQERVHSSSSDIESERPPSHSTSSGRTKTDSHDKGSSSKDLSNKEDHSDQASSNSSKDQNPPKKPDKILPCPRCGSMSTKFCYFNNYNVSQPRHFCKSCQRYWTAGGTIRNVPVGAGRRKNKSSRQRSSLVFPNASDGLIHQARRTNGGTVLVFGQDSSLSDQSRASTNLNGFLGPEMRSPASYGSFEDGKENAKTNSVSMEKGGKRICQGLVPQVPCFQGSSWTYNWNPMPWQSGYPVSLCSTPQWVCNSAGNRDLHYESILDQSCASSSISAPSPRKHSRDGAILSLRPSNIDNEEPTERKRSENVRVVVPRISRLDDPIEAASSSMWTTLRMKNYHISSPSEKSGFFGGIRPFNGFGHERHDPSAEASSMVLQLNPAAFSRSLTFHEFAR